ncbi:LysM peptidoglycan-binding domain-containing protein [Lederbergia wuyishanensis]|uniref:Nucleoid-associated protein YgaU n=1 Tax=Lederbergia wuyishanensis TaxID=1347903 RepID=A0ABU0D733_9BACI|nr:LysM peptidoglycan-binding domain-containing protein [Lederbergia wuyishanensis]MCJ8008896.1 LysM peptidoglycan-binding domain-containing protein [Lederbergia wuyishanensis]MDQ0344221.1 nucleoid-associated protein YgaU [Lederbergia wuyishanensis]
MHGIYFSVNNDKEGFQLPVNPEKVGVTNDGDGEEFTIAKIGNVNVPKDGKLKTYEIESFFPSQQYSFVVTKAKNPDYYVDRIEKWKENKWPVRFIYMDGSFKINELVTVESFKYDETGGSADVNFTLQLKQYKDFSPAKMKVVKPKTTNKAKVVTKKTPPRQTKKPQPKTYSLVKGDSLWKVAQKFLGSGTRYPEIAKLNGIKPSQYRRLPIGLKVKIPPK